MYRTELADYEGASGFILDWLLTGFFPNGTVGGEAPNLFDPKQSRHWAKDYLGAYGGAAAIGGIPHRQGLGQFEWLPIQAPACFPKLVLYKYRRAYLELDKAWPEKWDCCWYALAVIESNRDQPAELRFCGHDGCRLWFNGQFLFEEHSWHKLIFDLNILPVTLRRGQNTLLLKLDRWGLVARLTAPGGRPLAGKVVSLTTARPRRDALGTFDQLAEYSRTLKVEMPCSARTPAQFARWKKTALAHSRAALGRFPRVQGGKAKKIETVRRDGYTRWLFHLPREAGSVVPVHVLVPDRRRFNGRTVVCPHGHGQDDKTVAGLVGPEKPYGNWFGPFTGNYAELLAQAGFLTATWGERALSHERDDLVAEPGSPAGDACNVAGLCASAMGMTLPGLHLFDLHGVTDFVCGNFPADPRRLGLMGLSGGGTMTYLAGAYDDRFKALAPFCGVHSYAEYAKDGGCGQQVVPGLFPKLDVGELLCLIAPRPLLLAQGRKDSGFDVFLLQRFAATARRAYRALGAEGRVELHLFDGGHQVDADKAIEFFERVL